MTDASKSNTYTPVGVSGLTSYGGRIYEEYLTELQGWRWRRVLADMTTGDPDIGAILFAIQMLIRQVSWPLVPYSAPDEQATPEDIDTARYVESCLPDMRETWPLTLSEILSFLPWGHAELEVIFKLRQGEVRRKDGSIDRLKSSKYDDGKIGWGAWAIRSQDTLDHWEWDENGDPVAFVQIAPPNYIPTSIPLSKCLHFVTMGRKGNPEGFSMLRTAYRCYNKDMDILTISGWKNGLDVTVDDEVATLNPETGCLEYHHPTEVHRYAYNGEMLHISSRFLDLLVTPNHRLWVRRAGKQDFEFIEASEVNPTVHYKRSAGWEGEDSPIYIVPTYEVRQTFRGRYGGGREGVKEVLPPIEVPMDDWLAFLGIFLSDGCTYRRRSGNRQADVMISQKPGAKADRIRELLARLPWRVYEHIGERTIQFTISSVQLWNHLMPLGKAHTKYVPEYVKVLPPARIRIFLDWFHLGDGARGGAMALGYEGTPCYYSVSQRLADDLAELILKAGGAPSIAIQCSPGYGKGSIFKVTEGKPFESRATSYEWEDYNDEVWCITVPNHIVYVRRNGKMAWCGNSWFFKRKIENLEGVGFERDLAGLVVAKVPPELLDTLNRSPEQAAVYAAVESIVRNIHRDEQEGVVWPQAYDENGHLLYDLTLLTTGGSRQFSTDTAINRYSTKIAMSVMADFIILGHENVGSFALASSKTSLFATALGAWMDTICAVINTQAIPQLLRLNGLDPARAPTLTHGDIESIDLSALGAYLDALSKAGAPLFANDSENILYKHLLEQAGLPVPSAQAVTKDEGAPDKEQPADTNTPPDEPAQQANEPKRGSARASC
jgi:hypothetical protein